MPDKPLPADPEQHVFFVDDELIERLMRGDVVQDPDRKRRPASSSALAKAVTLATGGHLDDAVKELADAAERGESPAEVQAALGHLRFEQKNWEEAARCYGKVAEVEPKHRAAHYNLGLCLERQGKFQEAAKAFETALAIFPAAASFLMIDDDEIASPDWLEQMISAAEATGADEGPEAEDQRGHSTDREQDDDPECQILWAGR